MAVETPAFSDIAGKIKFRASKREFTVRAIGRKAAPSVLLDDIKAGILSGATYETVVPTQEIATALVRELNRAAKQVREVIENVSRPATVRCQVVPEGGQFVVLWQAKAPAAPPTHNADGSVRKPRGRKAA